MKNIPYTELARINPVCKYPVWIVSRRDGTTTNPMTKRRAADIYVRYESEGKRPGLIKAWSCVQGRKLQTNY